METFLFFYRGWQQELVEDLKISAKKRFLSVRQQAGNVCVRYLDLHRAERLLHLKAI